MTPWSNREVRRTSAERTPLMRPTELLAAGRAAALGEFPAAGSLPPGQRDRPDGAAAGPEPTDAGPGSGAGVNER